MKKSLLISGMFIAATFASQSALAEVKLRVGAASSDYKLSGDYIQATSSYSPITAGLTFASDSGFYVDLAYTDGKGKHDGWKTANFPTIACGSTSCFNAASASEDFKRNDYALIFGGSHLNRDNGVATTVYVGLKGGQTTLDAQRAAVAWKSETFDTVGVVFGGGASFPISQGKAGAVGVNLGLGVMGGTWKDTTGFSAKAKTTIGYSLGASYTYPITSNFGVAVDYKLNAYNYKFAWSGNRTVSITEGISTLGATAYVKF